MSIENPVWLGHHIERDEAGIYFVQGEGSGGQGSCNFTSRAGLRFESDDSVNDCMSGHCASSHKVAASIRYRRVGRWLGLKRGENGQICEALAQT